MIGVVRDWDFYYYCIGTTKERIIVAPLHQNASTKYYYGIVLMASNDDDTDFPTMSSVVIKSFTIPLTVV